MFKKPMSLVVSLPKNDITLAKAAWDNGADIVKVHMNVHHRASGTQFKSFEEERPFFEEAKSIKKGAMGIVAGGDIDKVIKDYEKAVSFGFDFISLFAHHLPARFVGNSSVSQAIAVDHNFPLNLIPYLHCDILEIATIDPAGYGQPLNAHDIAVYKAIASMTNKPIVIPTQRKILPTELRLIDDIGASAIMIGAVVTGNTASSLAATVASFRNEIDKIKELS